MQPTRRPISSRDSRWAAIVAGYLARHGIRPNWISIASAICGALGGGLLWAIGNATKSSVPWLFIGAALAMQLRLLCNLFDGMVAIEGGFKTKSGEIYNELPDRFADAFVLIGAGYSVEPSSWMPLLGWLAAALAILTAYVRALGASAGASQQFCGPMAKQHRMAWMTATCVCCAILAGLKVKFDLMPWTLAVIAAGSLATAFRRAHRIVQELERA